MEVKRLDALISVLSADRDMRVIVAYDAFLEQSRILMQEAEAYSRASRSNCSEPAVTRCGPGATR